MNIKRYNVTPRYSDAVTHAGTIYVVEVPESTDSDIAQQTREALTGLDARLKLAGSNRRNLLMVTIYLTNMADYAAMNDVWDAWLPEGCAPVRACVQVAGLARPGWRIELAAVAAIAAV